MARTLGYEYTVEPLTEQPERFPIDMLRYDCCWPAHETEAGKITQTLFYRGGLEPEAIQVFSPIKEPTVERWRSFGWRVISQSLRRVT